MSEQPFEPGEMLKSMPSRPGVYRMLDAAGEVLYVGKAKSLKKRVASYFRRTGQNLKTRAMLAQVADLEVTVTNTEAEALIFEQNLIKRLQPPYNIFMRDDKSYPYVLVSDRDEFPRIGLHRGSTRSKPGRYFGPYPGVGAVREGISLIQRVFGLRTCENSYFKNRSRPCLQYQIKRCSGPCVGLVETSTYAEDVRQAVLFLEGKSRKLNDQLTLRMDAAAAALDYETAAFYRDRIANLGKIQQRQHVDRSARASHIKADVITALFNAGEFCVGMLLVRDGQVVGNKTLFPKLPLAHTESEVLEAFVSRYYLDSGQDLPREIIVGARFEAAATLQELLSAQAGHRVRIAAGVRGQRAVWLEMTRTNAGQQLQARQQHSRHIAHRFAALGEALELPVVPERLECFDISHTSGEATVASCVVYDRGGPVKSDYRRFNIRGITGGDDYAAMEQVLRRRYRRLGAEAGKVPDILLVDGGRGQLGTAVAVLDELGVGGILPVGIAKGRTRKAGFERLFIADTGREIALPGDSPALHLVQALRDEAHRFAILGHRAKRSRQHLRSPLEQIEGVGPTRRRQLLRHFGGIREVERASIADLCQVPGISRTRAEAIYSHFHS